MPESRADAHLGGEWTLTVLGKDLFMVEDGQGEDRLIIFAMSKFNIVVVLGIRMRIMCLTQSMWKQSD